MLTAILVVGATCVLGYWTYLFLVQRSLLFPTRPDSCPTCPVDAQSVWIESAAGKTEAWFLPPLDSPPRPAPLLLFAHGNAELIRDWPEALETPREWGMAVLLVEYPGYGRSEGVPSRRTVQQTFEAAYDWAAARPDVDPSRIVLYGRSLGGGAVAGLSETRPAAALVLESTFTSTTALAAGMAAPSFLVRDRFDNLAAVRAFRGPRFVLHGDADLVIPTEHGRRLAAAAGVELHVMACGHNDCPRPWDDLRRFFRENGILS